MYQESPYPNMNFPPNYYSFRNAYSNPPSNYQYNQGSGNYDPNYQSFQPYPYPVNSDPTELAPGHNATPSGWINNQWNYNN